VIFNVSKAAGGIFFGVAFWTMAKTIHSDSIVRQYLFVAAAGFVLLFVADQAVVIVNAPYPPLGLTSISLTGLASYLIFAGIYSSAVSVSQDLKRRKSIRNFALTEASLLDSIGSAHMEQEIQNKVIMLTKQNREKMVE
jgi:Ca2+/Na+ antiporter